MAATKWVYVVLLMLLLSWWGSVCFAKRDINDKNQQVDKQEAFNGGVGASRSWGNNASFGVGQGGGSGGVGFNIGGSFGDGVGFGTGSGSGSGVGSGFGSGIGSGSGTSGGLGHGSGTGSGSGQGSGTGSGGKGSGTGSGSGQGSGTGSGQDCGTGSKGSGNGSGSGQGSGGCGSGCTGSGQASGIPSFQIPGLPPIPLWGLHCTPIECPAGNCGGIRMFFDYSQHTANLHANQETKTHEANQGINTHDHRQFLSGKISGASVVTHELKRSTYGSINSDEAKDYYHDQTIIASAPLSS